MNKSVRPDVESVLTQCNVRVAVPAWSEIAALCEYVLSLEIILEERQDAIDELIEVRNEYMDQVKTAKREAYHFEDERRLRLAAEARVKELEPSDE